MNPQMLEQAQNMMKNMTPEQMANMQQMMNRMSPEEMQNMQRMASSMGMGAAPGAAPPSGQAQYLLSGARVLKDDGNALHKTGNHAAAILKYDKALQNLSTHNSSEAIELKTSCELNKAMCHLKLEQWKPCEQICTQVLQRGSSLKALYRRGQAHLGLRSFRSATSDLQQALDLCPAGDTVQRDLIVAKLSAAQRSLAESPEDGSMSEPVSYNDGSIVIEEVPADAPAQATPAAAATRTGQAAAASASGAGSVSTDTARARLDAMCHMPEEQLRQTARAAGMPEMDGATAKQMAEMMRGMDPKQFDDMVKMAEQIHGSRVGAGPSTAAGAPPVDPAVAVDMMRNMSPQQMTDMAKVASDSGMMPPGVHIDPEMLKQSAEMMKNMSPEDLQRMQHMAASARQSGAASPAATTSGSMPGGMDAGGMADMLKDPQAMKTAMNMMKNMDEQQLADMMKMQQPNMSDEDAKRMAQQMKGMDDRLMGVILGGASLLAQARERLVVTKNWLGQNPAALVALVLLLIAVILRGLGIM